MEPSGQLSFDDLTVRDTIKHIPGRTAYIDEFGSFGFDFSSQGASKYYILCAVIADDSTLDSLHAAVSKVKNDNGLANTEMKSSHVGNNYTRRNRILSQLLCIDFHVILLIADKQKFVEKSPLTQYKQTFIKYLHRYLYEALYHVYPKLKIIEDEVGSSEFQEAFRQYIADRRPQQNLFNEYDFDYCDSKDELLIQLADMVGGSIGHCLSNENAPNYMEMLKAKILTVEYFPFEGKPYWGTTSATMQKFDMNIYSLAIKCATDFIGCNRDNEAEDVRAQVAFLKYLLFHVQNVDPLHYVSSHQLLSVIQQHIERRVPRNFLYRQVVAPLRDKGVVIASCSHGYKIPICADDITTYLNQSHTIVSPMLHRMEICRNLILQSTENRLDVLDDPAFLKYKKYFD